MHLGHAKIEQNDVRLRCLREPQPFSPTANRADNLYAAPLEQPLEPNAKQRVIVNQEHPHRRPTFPSRCGRDLER